MSAEPVAIKVTRYRCPTCRRSWSSKKRTAEHAAMCAHAPENRACLTCEHFDPGEDATYEEPGHPEGCAQGLDVRHDVEPGFAGRITRDCPSWAPASWVAR